MSNNKNTPGPSPRGNTNQFMEDFSDFPDILFSITPDGTFLKVNSTLARLLNQPAESLIGSNAFDSLAALGFQDFADRRRESVEQAVRSRKQIMQHDELFGKVWRRTIYPVASNGAVTHLIVMAQEVTGDIDGEKGHEHKLSALDFALDKLQLGAWRCELQTGKYFASDTKSRIFGYTTPVAWSEELFLSHIIADDRPRVKQCLAERLDNLHEWNSEYRICRADGEIRWIQDIGDIELDEQGKPVGMIGLVRDITELKLAAKKLRELERQWDFTFQSCRIGMWKIDLQSMILSRNKEHAELYLEDYDAKPTWAVSEVLDHVHIDDRARVKNILDNAFAENSDYNMDTRIHRQDGSVRWMHITAAFQFDDAGEPVSVLGTTQDITRQKELELDQQALQEQLIQSQKLELIGQLAGGIAHDVNNVLAAIQGNAELMLAGLDPTSPHHNNLTSIINSVNRSAVMVKQLLSFARKNPSQPVNIDIDAEIRQTHLMLRKLIRENIRLELKLDARHARVSLDPSHLVQILTNLVVNARDAIAESGTICIETGSIDEDEAYCAWCSIRNIKKPHIRIAISDTGTGIEPQALPHIFEPFFTTKGIGKGTGLGLSTVYGLAKQNNGHLFCNSKVGQGSTFEIHFPKITKMENTGPEAPVELHEATGNKSLVLVVEDEREISSIIKIVLEKQGCRVLVTENAESALLLFENCEEPVDLVISDIVLPGMNGMQLSRLVQQQHPDTKFLFMSGYSTDAIGHYGVFDEESNFIPKPFTIAKFVDKVHDLLNQHA